MARLAEDHAACADETTVLQNASDLVKAITQAMRAIAQLYANAIEDARLDAEMLIGLLYLGSGSARRDLESMFGFAICAPSEVIDRLIAAGFVSVDSNEMLAPTSEAQAIFRRLSRLAQKENQRWREQLQSVPGGNLVLDDFLSMLQSSHHA